jgi:hypothetical protein
MPPGDMQGRHSWWLGCFVLPASAGMLLDYVIGNRDLAYEFASTPAWGPLRPNRMANGYYYRANCWWVAAQTGRHLLAQVERFAGMTADVSVKYGDHIAALALLSGYEKGHESHHHPGNHAFSPQRVAQKDGGLQ